MAKQMHRIHATVGGASLASLISRADVIFVATSADQFLVTPEHFSGLTTTKFVFDLSMPRNVDPTVSQLPAVRLFTLDDLQQVVRRNLAQRKLLVLKAGPILVSILGQYKHWLVARTRPRVTKGAHRHAQFARKEISA
jgi:glutamyl-tRNA reductase